MQNGNISYWFGDAELTDTRASVQADFDADIILVGAGYTSLWTAYYLAKAQPDMRIVILESRFVGFGASGRNGGHLSDGMPGLERLYLKQTSVESVNYFRQQIKSSIDEVIRVSAHEGIEADVVKAGAVRVARNPAQLARIQRSVSSQREAEEGGAEYEMLSAAETDALVAFEGSMGGMWTPHCARVQPAKLAKGLAIAVERLGVKIYENSHVSLIEQRKVTLVNMSIGRAQYVIRATEGFTPSISGAKRDWLPKLSSQIVTEPLEDELIAQIWPSNAMATDMAHMYSYMQKTADNRIVIGGPGYPYYWGSRIDRDGYTELSSVRALRARLERFFPAVAGDRISHTWTGVLGVPRDWSATVQLDPRTGLGVVGGYVGSGVTGTNLAGRTMTDLILSRNSELTELPWVNRAIRRWEFEPIRWIALNGLYNAYLMADVIEDATKAKRTSTIATLANRISGRY